MNDLGKLESSLKQHCPESEKIPLYPGITLFYLTFAPGSFHMRHDASAHILQINYCKAGQAVWEMRNGNRIYLNPGDFSLHTLQACEDSVLSFPAGQYSGLTICIDLQEAAAHPPDLLRGLEMLPGMLREKFCRDNAVAFLTGDKETERIFSGFYGQPPRLETAYRRLKAAELLLYLSRAEFSQANRLAAYPSEQVEVVRTIHDRLIRHIGQRITIEELSRQYLINPTTLKAAFKAVYGTSLAAHIKEHRMEQAASLLRETDQSIAEIAQAVGYDSQSKFTAAFKAFFHVLPKEYRKRP